MSSALGLAAAAVLAVAGAASLVTAGVVAFWFSLVAGATPGVVVGVGVADSTGFATSGAAGPVVFGTDQSPAKPTGMPCSSASFDSGFASTPAGTSLDLAFWLSCSA